MAYIRKKKVKGGLYLYEVESYRDPETGKVKQRTLAYLGPAPRPPEEPEPDASQDTAIVSSQKLGTTELTGHGRDPSRIQLSLLAPPEFQVGDRVAFDLYIGGGLRRMQGSIVPCKTWLEGCDATNKAPVQGAVVVAGCLCVKYRWKRRTYTTQLPVERLSFCQEAANLCTNIEAPSKNLESDQVKKVAESATVADLPPMPDLFAQYGICRRCGWFHPETEHGRHYASIGWKVCKCM